MEELLEHSDWARRLATQLVGDAQRADDLVQEAWLVAIKSPPRHAENLRGWLGSVVRRLAASEWRGDRRRTEREERGARPEALPPTDQLVHEAQLSKELVEAVVAMPDPFKTVLLMRFFRDNKPAQIAKELGRPLATVKTQIQRGLEKLRDELDGRYGDRRSWCLALMPLVRGTAEPVSIGLGIGTWVAATGVLAIGLWGARERRAPMDSDTLAALELQDAEAEGLVLLPGDLPSEPAVADRERVEAPTIAQLDDEDPVAVEITSPTEFHLQGILLDLEFEPVAGMRLRWRDPGALRWKDETKSVIIGLNTWVPITSQERELFRSDVKALERFVHQNFARPNLGLALLADVQPPTFECVTDGGGRFELNLPKRSYGIDLLDTDFGVLGRTKTDDGQGPERWTWFVSRRRTLSGIVVDLEGRPVVDATVFASGVFPEALREKLSMGSGFSSERIEVQTDPSGRFAMEGVVLAPKLVVHAERGDSMSDYASIDLPGDASNRAESVTLVLNPSVGESPGLVLEGRVLQEDGSPAPRSTVAFGSESTITDADGRYQLPVRGGSEDLFATRSGSGIGSLPAPVANQPGDGEAVHLPDLVLPRTSMVIEGFVMDAAGNLLADVEVSVRDGLRVGRDSKVLEDISGGRHLDPVRTDATGQFRLNGLRDREYALYLRSNSRSTTTSEIRAGSKGVALVLP
jgi:RNA polymerase sigma factor (sigma-70 family)